MPAKLKEREKIGTILDVAVARKLRALAALEGRSISELIGDAVKRYETDSHSDAAGRKKAMAAFLNPGFRSTRKSVEQTLRLDYYEQ
jgi:Ribbon-helix-helix protein, copG family